MPKYKLKGRAAVLVQGGVEYREGDVIELSMTQALELKAIVEPVDDDGIFPVPIGGLRIDHLRNHEKQEILEKREAELLGELERVQAALAAIVK
jgi:hypothetical protein